MCTMTRPARLSDPSDRSTFRKFCTEEPFWMPPTGSDAARSSSTSSLTLQQHLSHHYRALAAARPTIDTGPRRQRKQAKYRENGRRRWRRGVDSAETASTTESADGRRLVEAILRDDRLPPQYYCRQQEQSPSAAQNESLPLDSLGDRPDSPDAASILGKIDSYLSQVQAAKSIQPEKPDRTTRRGPPTRSKTTLGAVGRSGPGPGPQRPPPAVPVRSLVSHKRHLINGDVIERFPQDFTSKRPFRPQVLRTSVSPRLRYLRVYRGPVAVPRPPGGRSPGRRPSHSLTSTSAASGSDGGQRAGGGGQRGSVRGECREDTEDGEEEEEEEDKEEEEEDEEEYGDDFEGDDGGAVDRESSGGASSRVPPLSISPDSDQEAWLREQASQALTRQRAAQGAKTNYRSPSKDSAYNGGFSSCSRGPTPEEAATQAHRPAGRGQQRGRPTVAPPAPPALSPAARTEESFSDEQAYVQFLSDVTSDILARGVFTNRILKRVMAAHVDRHRGKLDTARMRSELERLRLQLGIPDDDALDDAEHGFGCVGGGTGGASALPPTSNHLTAASPLALEPHTPTFVDPLLFPSGESWEEPAEGGRLADGAGATSDGQTAEPPSGRQVALESGEPPESVAALLASLSLDESVTRTILNCCQKQADAASITSDELRQCLDWRIPDTDVT